jgi:addiction module HigA family antidote
MACYALSTDRRCIDTFNPVLQASRERLSADHDQDACTLHPGEVLRKGFLIPLGVSAGALAKVCRVPRTRIVRLANEKSGVTADTALRLSKAFGTIAALWLNLQNDFDLRMAKHEIGKDLDKITPVVGTPA